MDPVPEILLLRKSGSAGNRSRELGICIQELSPLDHRGNPVGRNPTHYSSLQCNGDQMATAKIGDVVAVLRVRGLSKEGKGHRELET
jgi:hypothetical protein